MNKYQKLLTQIIKDDLKKPIYISVNTNFTRHRKIQRYSLKSKPIAWIRDFKNYNKRLTI